MENASTFDACPGFITFPLNNWWKVVRPYGVSAPGIAPGVNRLSPALLEAPYPSRLSGRLDCVSGRRGQRRLATLPAHFLRGWCSRALKSGPTQKARPESSACGVLWQPAEVPPRWLCGPFSSAFVGISEHSRPGIPPLPIACTSRLGEGWAATYRPAGGMRLKSQVDLVVVHNILSNTGNR
jgi:hypothetical protein